MYLYSSLGRSYKNVNGISVEHDPYAFKKIIPKGTKFVVCGVLVDTNYGSEHCCQDILAKFIDENGKVVEQSNMKRINVPISAKSLFKNTNGMPNENWIFLPGDNEIKEVPRIEAFKD